MENPMIDINSQLKDVKFVHQFASKLGSMYYFRREEYDSRQFVVRVRKAPKYPSLGLFTQNMNLVSHGP
jgi:hypothetical protein